MSIKIKIKKKDNIAVVNIDGKITAEVIANLNKKIMSLSKKNIDKIVIDMSDTDYIDSHGLGAFVYLWKLFETEGKEMLFMNPQGFVLDMFESSNLNKIMKVINSLEEI